MTEPEPELEPEEPRRGQHDQPETAVFYGVLDYAVQLNDLDSNPLHKVKWTPPKTSETVDPRVMVNPARAAGLLVVVAYVGKMRTRQAPDGVLRLHVLRGDAPRGGHRATEEDCTLPSAGWGSITLAKSRPEVNRKWTDSGDTHEERGLKHRSTRDVRIVPIPPILVAILRSHLKDYGTGNDGLIFRSERGKPVASTAYTDVWKEARRLPPYQAESPSPAAPTTSGTQPYPSGSTG
jgi:hypothetical protein